MSVITGELIAPRQRLEAPAATPAPVGHAVPVRRRVAADADGHSVADHARAAAIVAEHGDDSLSPFLLATDKRLHFAWGGVLAYRLVGRTAVVSGDPVGPPGTASLIVADFERVTRHHGRRVALTAAGTANLDEYRALGFETLCIGEEAVVDPAGFSLSGRAMKALRHSVTRQTRLGWGIELLAGRDLNAGQVREIDELERGWRNSQDRITGFAMTLGRLWGAVEDDTSLFVLGRDPDGRLRAFLRFARYPDGLSLDVMRRFGETPNGLVDAMVVATIEWVGASGLRAVSLNFAGFAQIMAPGRAQTRGAKLVRGLLSRTHGCFQLEKLVMFNKKFRPRWEPRYLVYRGRHTLPSAGLRVLQAEGYLPAPRRTALLGRWEPLSRPWSSTAVRPAPAANSATATQVPDRENWGVMWSEIRPEIAAASAAAPAASSSTAAVTAVMTSLVATENPAHRSASPATAPAGNQAATSRSSGCVSPPESCSSGNDAEMPGPAAKTPAERIRYSQPIAAATARIDQAHAAAPLAA